jgi:hypothetical protein
MLLSVLLVLSPWLPHPRTTKYELRALVLLGLMGLAGCFITFVLYSPHTSFYLSSKTREILPSVRTFLTGSSMGIVLCLAVTGHFRFRERQ